MSRHTFPSRERRPSQNVANLNSMDISIGNVKTFRGRTPSRSKPFQSPPQSFSRHLPSCAAATKIWQAPQVAPTHPRLQIMQLGGLDLSVQAGGPQKGPPRSTLGEMLCHWERVLFPVLWRIGAPTLDDYWLALRTTFRRGVGSLRELWEAGRCGRARVICLQLAAACLE